MPSIFNVFDYKIYFWTNENGESVHVHVVKGTSTANATKLWSTQNGTFVVAHNKSRIPTKDLAKIKMFLTNNRNVILAHWINCFGTVSYYC